MGRTSRRQERRWGAIKNIRIFYRFLYLQRLRRHLEQLRVRQRSPLHGLGGPYDVKVDLQIPYNRDPLRFNGVLKNQWAFRGTKRGMTIAETAR
jgi:hypothetical protein